MLVSVKRSERGLVDERLLLWSLLLIFLFLLLLVVCLFVVFFCFFKFWELHSLYHRNTRNVWVRWGGLGSVSVSDADSSICLRHKRDKIPSAVNSLNV